MYVRKKYHVPLVYHVARAYLRRYFEGFCIDNRSSTYMSCSYGSKADTCTEKIGECQYPTLQEKPAPAPEKAERVTGALKCATSAAQIITSISQSLLKDIVVCFDDPTG